MSGPKEQDLERPPKNPRKTKADGYYDLIGHAGPDTRYTRQRPKFHTRFEIKQGGTLQYRQGACAFAFPLWCKRQRRGGRGSRLQFLSAWAVFVCRVSATSKAGHGCSAHLLVGVKSVDDQREELVDVGRESEGLGLDSWGLLRFSHDLLVLALSGGD